MNVIKDINAEIRQDKKKFLLKIFLVIVGILITAVSVNLFYVPNNFVTGGVTGIAIIVNHLTKMDINTFVFFSNLVLIGIGFIFLGVKTTLKSAVGAMLYSLFLYLTRDVGTWINFSFDNTLLYALAAGICAGFGDAIVYKLGYSTGGTGILGIIISEKTKKPVGKIIRYISFVIIACGGMVFGYTMVMYALIIVAISTFLLDKIMLGISDSKMFIVQTVKEEEVREFIMGTIRSGITEYETKGGYSGKKKKMLMCVVPTEKYTHLKEAILLIDESAFIIVSDCYEVVGGTKRRKKLPI